MEASVLVKALRVNSHLYPGCIGAPLQILSHLSTGDLSGFSFMFLTKVLCLVSSQAVVSSTLHLLLCDAGGWWFSILRLAGVVAQCCAD